MELTKNIFFNTDKLIENKSVKLSYTGELFKENYEGSIYIHYGFGPSWENVSELEMIKTELGYQIEIVLPSNETFNFCFRNSENIWDNNKGVNYIFPIEKGCTDLIALDTDISLSKPKRLRKTYILSKKIRLAVYKLIKYVPKIISGNYKRKAIEE